jgi:hypothetical protein
MNPRWIALALALLLPLGASAQAVAPEKEEAIRKLLRVTGAVQLGTQVSSAMVAQMKPAFRGVPERLWKELEQELGDTSEFTDLMIPVYARHYSLEDLEALIAFYESPLGRRVVSATPAIAQESMALGQRWGQLQAQKVIERLRAEGYTQQL